MRRFVQDFSGLEGAPALRAVPPRFNIAVRKPAAIIAWEDDAAQVREAQWGLIPAWSKQFETRYTTQTARLERAPASRIFRGAWKERRCVVPMSGYFKWDRSVKPAVPYFIHAASGEVLYAAGLWERWSKEEPARDSFAILTHPTDAIPAPLTPDGPIFLSPAQWPEWIAGKPWFPQRFLERAKTPELAAYAVSNAVRDPDRDDYTLLEPRTEADAALPPPPDEDFDDDDDA